MKWVMGVALLFLLACSQAEPYIAPTVEVVFECQRTQNVGEGCLDTCECLKPAQCLDGVCLLTDLPEGSPCAKHEQCYTQICEQSHCASPASDGTDCDYICRDDYPSTERTCYLACR